DQILCKTLGHVHRGQVLEALVAILRSRLPYLAYPVGRTLGRQREAHPGQNHHDAAHDTEGAVLATGDHDAGDFTFDRAATRGAVLLVECVETLDSALHQARAAAPPDRCAEEHDIGELDLGDEFRPVIFRSFAKAEANR